MIDPLDHKQPVYLVEGISFFLVGIFYVFLAEVNCPFLFVHFENKYIFVEYVKA